MSNPKGIIIHPESQKAIDKLPEEAKTFIADLITKCLELNVTLKFYDKHTHNGCLGLFDFETPILYVCTHGKQQEWLSTAVHESCHMDQWIEGSKYYKNFIECPYDWCEWLDGNIELTRIQSSRAINVLQAMELDCEKRAVKKMVEYNLSHVINISEYIKKANDALFTWTMVKDTRKWPNWRMVRGKYRKLWTDQPDYFLKSYKYVPKWFRDLTMELIKK